MEIVKLLNDIKTLDSREVAEMLDKRHDNLTRDIKGYIKDLEESSKLRSHEFFIESTYKNIQNKMQPCYLITKLGCEFVGNKLIGKKGNVFTASYVKRFNEMEQEIQYKLPKNYKEALLQLVEAEEEKEKLKLEVQSSKPKVIFADAVSTSKTCILVGELAKILKQNGVNTGQNRFFEWLRVNGYLVSRKGTDYNMPTQKSMELDLFEVKETSVTHSDGHISLNKTPKVTGKGQQYFINKLLQESNKASC